MPFNPNTLTFTRASRFETDSRTRDQEKIRQSDHDRMIDDLVAGMNQIAAWANDGIHPSISTSVRSFLSVQGQRDYMSDSDGQLFELPSSGVVVAGSSPFGLLSPADYTTDSLGIHLNFSPAGGDLYTVISFPRVSNSEAQAILQGLAEAVEGSGLTYPNRDAARVALPSLPPTVLNVGWKIPGGGVISVARQAGATAIPDMPGWVPSGAWTFLHFGAVGDGTTVDTPAVHAAYAAWPLASFDLMGRNYRLSNGAWDAIRSMRVVGSGKLVTSTGSGPVFAQGMVTSGDNVDVGFNGFSRVQYAIDFLSMYRPYGASQVQMRITGTASFQWEHGVTIPQKSDMGWVTIVAQGGAILTLPATFVGVTAVIDSFMTNCLLYAHSCVAPVWGVMVNCNDRCGTALVYTQGARGTVAAFRGVNLAGGYGIYVSHQSDVIATNALFTNPNWGNRVTTNSRFSAPQANFSGTRMELYSGGDRSAGLDVSRGSLVYITGTSAAPTNLTGGQGRGLAVRRSFVSATDVDCSNNLRDGLNASAGAYVAFDNSVARDCGGAGAHCDTGTVTIGGAAKLTGCAQGIVAVNGGRVSGRDADCTGATTNGILSIYGGDIRVPGVLARKGASDVSTDIVVNNGGTIVATGGTGGTSVTENTLSSAGYIIK